MQQTEKRADDNCDWESDDVFKEALARSIPDSDDETENESSSNISESLPRVADMPNVGTRSLQIEHPKEPSAALTDANGVNNVNLSLPRILPWHKNYITMIAKDMKKALEQKSSINFSDKFGCALANAEPLKEDVQNKSDRSPARTENIAPSVDEKASDAVVNSNDSSDLCQEMSVLKISYPEKEDKFLQNPDVSTASHIEQNSGITGSNKSNDASNEQNAVFTKMSHKYAHLANEISFETDYELSPAVFSPLPSDQSRFTYSSPAERPVVSSQNKNVVENTVQVADDVAFCIEKEDRALELLYEIFNGLKTPKLEDLNDTQRDLVFKNYLYFALGSDYGIQCNKKSTVPPENMPWRVENFATAHDIESFCGKVPDPSDNSKIVPLTVVFDKWNILPLILAVDLEKGLSAHKKIAMSSVLPCQTSCLYYGMPQLYLDSNSKWQRVIIMQCNFITNLYRVLGMDSLLKSEGDHMIVVERSKLFDIPNALHPSTLPSSLCLGICGEYNCALFTVSSAHIVNLRCLLQASRRSSELAWICNAKPVPNKSRQLLMLRRAADDETSLFVTLLVTSKEYGCEEIFNVRHAAAGSNYA